MIRKLDFSFAAFAFALFLFAFAPQAWSKERAFAAKSGAIADNKTQASDSPDSERPSKEQVETAQKLFAEGKKLLSAQQYRTSEEALRKSLQLDESNDQCRLTYAICLYNLDRLYGALSNLEAVAEKDPDNPDAYLYLGHCYLKTRKTQEAIDAYERFIKLRPKDPEREKYVALIGALSSSGSASSRGSSSVSAGATSSAGATKCGDYLKEVFDAGVYRWPQSRLPITVFVEPADNLKGYRPEFDDILRHAFREWSSTTKNKIQFKIVNQKDKARMIITWTDDLHAPELRAEAGIAGINQDVEGISHATVRLLTIDPFKQGPIGNQFLYDVCLHEIGHALGLMGHSPYPDDIMYPILSTQSGISPRDAATLSAIYSSEFSPGASKDQTPMQFDEQTLARMTPKQRAEILCKQGTKACLEAKWEESLEP